MKDHELPGSIFTQPWWLDIVAPKQWEDIQIKKGEEIFARMPIVKIKRKGFNMIEMPILTHKMGPWIKETSPKQERRHSNERKLLQELIDELPEVDYFSYNLDTNIQNFLPFVWKGFEQSSLSTFKFEFPFQLEELWKGMKSSVRRGIKRAKEELSLDSQLSISEAYELIEKTFTRQNIRPPFSENILERIFQEANSRNRISIIGARDKQNKLVASQVYIHDDDCTYYIAGGIDSDSNVAGLASYLIWEGINIAHSKNNSFDFEGSSIQSIENFFSTFGAKHCHYHRIYSVSKRFAPFYYGKKLIQRLKF